MTYGDAPKTLASERERAARAALLSDSHVEPLVRWVNRMRRAMGPDYSIPDVDPLDGGIAARVLFLLEAPGPKAITTGFVSRNNPDETAKNFFLLNAAAGIDRRHTIVWNAVPWYIGSGAKIRPAKRDDVSDADVWLTELLMMLQQLEIVMFVGQKALYAKPLVSRVRSDVDIMAMPHPSPVFINRAPANRERVLARLRELSGRRSASRA